MTHECYKARIRTPLHPLIASCFFWRGLAYLDVMHIVDCRGVLAVMFGSIIEHVLRDRTKGANRPAEVGGTGGTDSEWVRCNQDPDA